jgi:quercetin dioxygenase-like cupin family protein
LEIFDVPAISEFRSEAMWRKVLIDSPGMYVSLLTFEPGQELRVHSHPSCDIWIYVIVGEAYTHCGDEEKVLRGGQAMHIPPNTWHGILNESDSPCMVMSVQSPKAKISNWRDFDPGESMSVAPCATSTWLPLDFDTLLC